MTKNITMLQYILETLIFQLIFLLVYDLFLKKETFFQWNRFYLLATFVLSLVLPWIKIEALKTTVSSETVFYPQFLFQLDGLQVAPQTQEPSFWELLSWQDWVYGIGSLFMAVWFVVKLYSIQQLKNKGVVNYYPEFTKVVVRKSEVAFSFFKTVFLGDGIPKVKEPQILAHELVHIKQRHSLDLLFFELMRIVLWFNPLVYIYQNKIAVLHEYIADAHVAKSNKKEQYQLLLSEAFQTQNLSFVNQFFTSSLIKKRIVMLTKEKSKTILQLKYLLMVPIVLGMLVYSSCEKDILSENNEITIANQDDRSLIRIIENELKNKSLEELMKYSFEISKNYDSDKSILSKLDFFKKEMAIKLSQQKLYEKRPFKHPDDIFIEIPYPSTQSYEQYKNWETVFQVLDKNLKISINQRKKTIRFIVKEDKNLGAGEWITVQDVKDLTGDEVRKVNQALDAVEGTDKFVAVSDNEYSFLIGNIIKEPVLISIEETTTIENSKSNTEPVPFAIVDEIPVFPSCENASDKRACFQEQIQNHIKKHFNYPKEAQDLGIQGRVSIVFTIDVDGSIINIRKRGPHKLLEDETERIIRRLPKMIPGKQEGEAVKVPFSIPITFKLQDSSDTPIPFPKMATENEGLNIEVKEMILKYNKLVNERERLLKSANRKNPIIVSLEEQLTVMKIRINESIEKTN
jgi:TonB family protein